MLWCQRKMVIKLDHRHKKLDGDLLLTTTCPVECDFCVYSCKASKDAKKWMGEKTIKRVAEEYSKNDIGVRIGGGEPFYDLKKLERCLKIVLVYYKPNEILIITSGFFGDSKKNTKKHLEVIKKLGIDTIVISTDRFHLKRIPLKNIRNIIEISQKIGIEPVLRISIDSESYELIDELVEIIVKNRVPIEVHDWGVFGRAESLDKSPLGNFNKDQQYFFSKISEVAKKFNAPPDWRYYLTHSAKRSQRRYASDFFPTTFPNGNVYGCSMTMKGSYLGNINDEDLVDMLVKWKTSLPGHFCLSETSCQQVSKFLPDKYNHRCEYCKSYPLKIDGKEALGQKFLKIDTSMNLDKIFEKIKDGSRELLISFRLTEKDLNRETGSKIKEFLDKLEEGKIRYVLSRPLPRCLGFATRAKDPKNCSECRELFTIEDERVKYCEPSGGLAGWSLDSLKDRSQIHEYFEIEHRKKNYPKICEKCFFRNRGQCDGLCFKK
ncbi:MAG: radical SAM protein [Candidatus Aenigmarchaeota archaeon]|nr:radical SAM protein [Candidatus Aenigmarchaeota archaeon]